MKKEFLTIDGKTYYGEVIRTPEELDKLVNILMTIDEFAFDTETNTLKVQAPGFLELVGISFCFGNNNTYYIPTGHVFDEEQLEADYVIEKLKPVFARKDIRLIGWNIKYDLHVITTLGIQVATEDIWDGMIAVWDIDENESKSLKEATKRIFGYEQPKIDTVLATVTKEEKLMYGIKGNQKPPFQLTRIDVAYPYAMQDAFWTWRHYVDYQQDIIEMEQYNDIFKTQMKFLLVLFNMERRGIKIDVEKLKIMQKEAEKDLKDLEYKIYELAGLTFDIGSSQQLAELLFGYKKINKKGEFAGNKKLVDNSFNFPCSNYTDTGVPATGEDALLDVLKLNYIRDKRKQKGQELVKLILKYKKLMKLKSAFMDGLLDTMYPDGKIHPNFNLGGASSGRLSCSDPNVQQLPRPLEEPSEPKREKFSTEEEYQKAYKYYLEELDNYNLLKKYEIRELMIPDDPEKEVLIASDFSNLELRVMGMYSLDPALVDAFDPKYNNGHGKDVHGSTAVTMFDLDCDPDQCKKLYPQYRQIGKTLNFLLIYGGTPRALSQQLGVDEETAKKYYNLYFEKFKGVKKYMDTMKKLAHERGYVTTMLGRKRRLKNINSDNYKLVSYEERLALNAPIQGTASDIAMCSQIKAEYHPRLKEIGCRMISQVHDELIFICPEEHVEEAIKIIKECMENPFDRELPIKLVADADYGKSYAEAK